MEGRHESTAPHHEPVDGTSPAEPVRAAGGLVTRGAGADLEILLVHRAARADWSLPKGRVEEGESLEQAAVREVREETGVTARLGAYAGVVGYDAGGIRKVVSYWRMTPESEGSFHPTPEIAERVWLPVGHALERLTHSLERALVHTALQRRAPVDGDADEAPARRFFLVEWADWTFLGGRARSRLNREFQLASIEVERLAGTDDPSGSLLAARRQLDAVRRSLAADDFEGGWPSLHAARRSMLSVASPEQLRSIALSLLKESSKLGPWRAEAVRSLLSEAAADPEKTPTRERVIAAMEHRDAHSDNTYHKIGLMADQLGMLFWIAAVPAVVFFLCVLSYWQLWPAPTSPQRWDFTVVVVVMALGVLGATLSAVQSLIGAKDTAIPERVGNKYVTIIRAWCGGAVTAIAGHAILASGLLAIEVGTAGLSSWIALGFLFGYAGERPISRVAETLNGGGSGNPPRS